MTDLINRFMEIFHGLERAYGTYDLKRTRKVKRAGEKILGKPKTKHNNVTPELWKNHIEGRQGIGIIPIRDDSTCYFGAIDIDIYDGLKIKEIIKNIQEFDLPLIPCRTKSGGLHLFTFTKDVVPALLIREKLFSFAASLGFGESEIFPKQNEILSDRGDIGQWINMPYFNGDKTDRYAYTIKGKEMTMAQFIKAVDKVRFTKKEFEAFTINVVSDIQDGPPCLQHLITQGFSPGTRNEGLFNIAVYIKKSQPQKLEELLDDYNVRFFDPPLTTQEINQITKSVKRKDYNFACEKPPIKNYCNLSLCRTREFGVGQLTGMPQLTGLTKFDTAPPIWFLDVDKGQRLEVSTEDLQSQQRFQRRCMESLNTMPPAVKGAIWQGIIQTLLDSVTIIEAPGDASPKGLLFEHLERFCTSRAQARTKDELLLGKPWTNGDKCYFRIVDFMAYLERQRFKEYKVNKICSMMREDLNADHAVFTLKGKTINVWKIPAFAQQTEKFKSPDIGETEVF